MITGMDHMGLVVQDIEKQLAFYRDALGLLVDHDRDVRAPAEGDHTGISNVHRRLIFLKSPSGEPMFELIEYISPKSPTGHILDHHQVNSIHLCFKVVAIGSTWSRTTRPNKVSA
ncbi:MAG: VOC family protein [Pseudomonadota bacterium]